MTDILTPPAHFCPCPSSSGRCGILEGEEAETAAAKKVSPFSLGWAVNRRSMTSPLDFPRQDSERAPMDQSPVKERRRQRGGRGGRGGGNRERGREGARRGGQRCNGEI
eukprot:752710-Hanusia_phi.AAC.6